MNNFTSSRTPEGRPNECPVCGALVQIEPSAPAGDAPCPQCGSLLWFVADEEAIQWFEAAAAEKVRQELTDIFRKVSGAAADETVDIASLSDAIELDSLETVELVMELEEAFDLDIPDAEAERITTVAQAIAYILRHRGKRGGN